MDMQQMESAILEGQARFERWKQAFEAQLVLPYAMDALRELIGTLTPEQTEMLRQSDPKAYQQVMKMIGGR